MPRPLRYLFEREMELLRRLGSPVRSAGRMLGLTLGRWLGVGASPRRSRVDRLRRTLRRRRERDRPIDTSAPPRLRIRRLPRGLTGSALVVSICIHLVLAAFLVTHLFHHQPERVEPQKEVVISIRLPARKKTKPQPKNPDPPAQAPKPTPQPRPKPEPKPQPKKPQPAVAKKKPDPVPTKRPEPRRTTARKSTRKPLLVRPFNDPPPLGVGIGRPRPTTSAGGASIGSLSSRGEEGKLRALAAFGGNGRTENAVDLGLRWLAEHQDADGGWDARGFQRHCRHYTACPGQGLNEFDIGVSSLAVLAFLGAGHTPFGEGIYRRHVAKGLQFLMDQQSGSGSFAIPGDKYLYNHALATLALAEAFAMTGDEIYKESLHAAVRYSLRSQQPGGAWDYTSERTGRHDLSVTGWQIMALRGAEQAGVPISAQTKQGIRHFLNRAFTESGHGIYANLDPEKGRRGVNMVAVGLLSHLYAGGFPDDRRTRNAVRRILPRNPPIARDMRRWDLTFQSYYYWYAATLALFHLGGKPWDAWNELLQEALLPLQEQQVHIRGSWDPEASWIGLSGGRVYSTAINVLTLEVYYRYKPLFATRKL